MKFCESASGNFYDGLTGESPSEMPIFLTRPDFDAHGRGAG